MKRNRDNILTKNLGLKIIALFAAFCIWLIIVNINDARGIKSFYSVPVSIEHAESITSNDRVYSIIEGDKVTLKVTARRSVRDKLQASDFRVVADLRNLTFMSTVPLRVTCSNTSVSEDDIRILPSSLKIKVENKGEMEFPVKVSTSGTPAKGYEVGRTEIAEGNTVLIAGPQTLLDIIDKVTLPISVDGMSTSSSLEAGLKIVDRNGAEFSEAQMNSLEIKTVEGYAIPRQMNVKVELWRLKTGIKIVADTKGVPASGYRVVETVTTPETISLAGTEEALAKLSEGLILPESDQIDVNGASANIEKEIDLQKVFQDNAELFANLKFEQDAATTVKVKVHIEKRGNKTLNVPIANLEIIGQPQNMSIKLTPADKVPVEITALTQDLDALAAESIMMKLDLTEYQQPGNYTVPLAVTVPEGYELASEVTIIVNIEEIPPETETEIAGGE